MDRFEIIDYLLSESDDFTYSELFDMTPRELIDTYLTWNGIVGFTSDIIDVVLGALGIEVPESLYETYKD